MVVFLIVDVHVRSLILVIAYTFGIIAATQYNKNQGSEQTTQGVGVCAIPHVVNGHIATPRRGYMPGNHARIFCLSGYFLYPRNGSPLIRCNTDGSWGSPQQTPPTCEADASLECQAPSGIQNGGYRVLSSNEYVTAAPLNSEYITSNGLIRSGTRVKYFCVEGYRLSSSENLSVVSCRDGIWIGVRPSCIQRRTTDRCGSLPVVPHARSFVLHDVNADVDERRPVVTEMYVHGTRAVFFCDHGYQWMGSGSSAIECVKGEWSGRLPTCMRDVKCLTKPPAVSNAEVTIYNSGGEVAVAVLSADSAISVAENSRAVYFCQSGYQLANASVAAVVCSDGQWRGQLPSCEMLVTCQPPSNVEHAGWDVAWFWNDFRAGAEVVYTCQPGYMLVGADRLRCQNDGTWSSVPPRCLFQSERCRAPNSITNGFYICKSKTCDQFPVGSEVYYFCKPGFKLKPPSHKTAKCLPSGRWEPETPSCLEGALDLDERYRGGINRTLIPVGDGGNQFILFPDDESFVRPHTVAVDNPLTVVVITSSTLIGVLAAVIVAVIVRWVRIKHSRLQRRLRVPVSGQHRLLQPPLDITSSSSSRPLYSVIADHANGDHLDRLALIAFSDDVFALPSTSLPTYEEAVQSPLGLPHTAPGVGFSMPPAYDGQPRPLDNVCTSTVCRTSVDHRRHSTVTTGSCILSGAAGFGSIDTVHIAELSAGGGDVVSTSITVDTLDSSSVSMTPSQRALHGSIESSSTHDVVVVAADAAPLLLEIWQQQHGEIDAVSSCLRSLDESASRSPRIEEELKD